MGTKGMEGFEQLLAQRTSSATRYFIGIDPGVHTGIAIWDSQLATFVDITSDCAVAIENKVLHLREMFLPHKTHLVVEDSRGNYLPPKERNESRIRGVGSVQRDMQRWEEFAKHHDLQYTMQPLKVHNPFRLIKEGSSKRKMVHEEFEKITGWKKRTNEHERCAAGLVYRR